MAHLMTLENWTLDNGVFRFALERATDVRQALAREGLISARPEGLGILHEAWIYRCAWTYEAAFDWSFDDERCQLIIEDALAACTVTVNGAAVLSDCRARVPLDISHALAEGENKVALTFDAPAPTDIPMKLGLIGQVRLRAGSAMTLESFDAAFKGNALSAHARLTVFTPGRYAFHYVVALGDDAVLDTSVTEALRPGAADVSHALDIASPAQYDPANPDDTRYTVRLSIERLGICCQLAFAHAEHVVRNPRAARKVLKIPDWVSREEFEQRLPLIRQLGVGELAVGARPNWAAEFGFLPYEPADTEVDIRAFGALEKDAMAHLAGGEKFWPPGAPVWKVTGSAWDASLDLSALFGVNAMGDASRAARLARFLQAESVRRQAFGARIKSAAGVLDWPFEPYARYAGYALVEFAGAARPAYDALEEAWKPVALYAELPGDMRARPGERLSIGAWLLDARGATGALTVDIACYAMDGSLLYATALPGAAGANARVGELAVTLPSGEGFVAVRLTASEDGRAVAASDWTLCVTGDEAPLSPLLKLPLARLRQQNDALINEGTEAVPAVCSQGYRTLLPGESMPSADTYECLSGLA